MEAHKRQSHAHDEDDAAHTTDSKFQLFGRNLKFDQAKGNGSKFDFFVLGSVDYL